jgi:cellulose synthase/poly-beta-1,6-N-acetylglucosamine synthase-like glycosyltransferase
MNLATEIIVWVTYFISLYFAIFWFLTFIEIGIPKDENRKLKKFPMVTVAIPVYNREDSVEPTIRSVLELDYPKDKLEIIAVDHGSTDKSLERMKKFKDKVKIIHIGRNPSERKGRPMNVALEQAKGEFFVCLDADSIATKDSLVRILPHLEDKSVGCVLPSMKVYKPKRFWHKVQNSEYMVNMFYKRLMSYMNCIHVAPGPFSVFRTETLRKIGGYDSKNLTEDLELTYRLQKNQYKIVQLMDTFVYTIAPKSFKEIYLQRNRWFKGAFLNTISYRKMLFNKKYGDFGLIQLPMVLISGAIAVSLLLVTVYFGFIKYIKDFIDLRFINFDIITLIRNLRLEFNIFDLDFALICTSIVAFLISATIIIKAFQHSNEKVLKQGIIPVAFFFIYYYLVMGIAWLGVMFDLLRRKQQRW